VRLARRVLLLLMLLGAAVSAVRGPSARAQAPDSLSGNDGELRADPTIHRDTLNIFKSQPFQLRPFVLPGSERVVVDGVRLDTTQYRLDARPGHLWLNIAPPSGDSRLTVAYRTFPFAFREVYRRRGVADTTATGALAVREEDPEASGADASGFDPFEGVSLQRSGSISRGVIAGSNRDATVESGLRFQLSGDVSDEVSVQAVLTDENTPLQPEGTTQRLDDFDRVFVELAAPQGTARLGDVNFELDGTTFARFQRKIQGASVTGGGAPADGTRWLGEGNVEVAGATSRGQYRLQQIEPRDGVQGPYQLRGSDGEDVIIVIAGSEKVYLDGQRLTRGASADYTIDYARAEITFTSEHLITEDQRIRVEFEYRTSSYSRTLVAGQGEAGFWKRPPGSDRAGEPRLTVGASFIREADSRSLAGGAFDLTARDSLRLVQAGDDVALGSAATRVAFDPESPFVPYRRAPHPDGAGDSIYVALDEAPPEGASVLRVRFSRVGANQGSYVRAGRGVNGIVYEYRGEGQGRYTPRRQLPRPQQQRLLDVHGQFEPVDGVEIFGEWARSVNDQNRFSDLDEGNDRDRAYHTGVRLTPLALEVGGLSLGRLRGAVERRFRGQHFSSFVRTRPVEFGRKWNLPAERVSGTGGVRGAGDETIDEARLRLDVGKGSSVRAEVGRLTLGEAFRGVRRVGRLRLEEAGWPRLDYRAERVTSRDRLTGFVPRDEPFADEPGGPGGERQPAPGENIDGRWLRQRGALWKPLLGGDLVPRLEVDQERRLQRVTQRASGTAPAQRDSLARRSFSFVEVRPNVTFRPSDALSAGAEVEFRTEDEALGGDLQKASSAWTVQTNASYEPSENLNVGGRVGYRHRRVTDAFRESGRKGTSSLLAQVEGRWRPLDRAVEVRGLYRAQTERTPTLQELYVRVGPERGQYTWEDSNDDGLVQTDELLPERTPNEGAYVRRYVPSDSLQAVASVEARLRVELTPARQWRGADASWKSWLARAETQTTIEINEESRTSDLAGIYLLDQSAFRRPGVTQQGRLRLAQRLRLFPNASRYGLDLGVSRVRSLNDLAAGEKETFRSQWEAEGRYRPGRRWSVSLRGLLGQNRTESEAFASRRYDIRRYQLEPKATFRPVRDLRLTASGVFARKSDAVGTRRAQVLRAPLEGEWSRVRRLRLTARGEVSRVTITGEENATGRARYELTDGRGVGTTFRWGVGGRYAINEFLSASLSYDGRAPSEAPVVHTARLNLSASF
jgi:hypothetical protein